MSGVPMSFSDSTTMSPTAPPAYFSEVVVAGSCWYGKVSVCKHSIQSQKAYCNRKMRYHATAHRRKPQQQAACKALSSNLAGM